MLEFKSPNMLPRILAALAILATFAAATGAVRAADNAAEPDAPATAATPAAPAPDALDPGTPEQPSQDRNPSVALSPSEEQASLAAIRAAGQASVLALVEQLTRAADDAARLDLQKRIQQEKLETEVRFLDESARLARARSDERAAVEAERVRDQILQPGVPAENATPQPMQKDAAQAPNAPNGQQGGSK